MNENKKPLLSYLIVCDSVAQAPDGKLTLYGLFSKIFAHELPAAHPFLSIAMVWGFGSPAKHKTKLIVKNPSGKDIFSTPEIDFELKKEDDTANFIMQVQGLRIEEEGKYWAVVYLDGEIADQKTMFSVEKRPKKAEE